MGGDATLGAGERVRQRPLGAGAIELLPRGRNELDQPAAPFRAGGEAAVRSRTPETLGGHAQDLEPLRERQADLEEGGSEAFEEHGVALDVGGEEAGATVAVSETEKGDLVPGCFVVARDEELEDAPRAVFEGRFGDERLGSVGVGAPHGHGPLALELGDERWQLVEPGLGAKLNGIVANDVGDGWCGCQMGLRGEQPNRTPGQGRSRERVSQGRG